MRRTHLALVAAVALGLTAVLIRTQIGAQSGAATVALQPAVAAAEPPPHRTTTSTTVAAPTTTTTPPPPTAPATTAPMRVRAAAAPAPAPKPAPAPVPAPAPAPTITADPASETRALQLVNQERSRNGLPALQLNSGATSVARSWSRWMAGHSLAHNPNLGRDLNRAGVTGWKTAGENVGNAPNADQAHAMFMASGTHRANILGSEFSQVGVGAVRRAGQVWITLDFVGW